MAERFLFDDIYEQRENRKHPYLRMKKTGAVSCPPMPREIDVLAESKSIYLKDSLQIFVEYFEELLKENEEIKSNTLKVEIADLRQSIIYNQELDTNFFLLSWDKIDKEQTTILYKFSVQTTKNREIKSFYHVLQKAKQPLSYPQEYFKSKEKQLSELFFNFCIFIKILI
ncbi:hypothetical protein ACE193_01635 [Bernardetia sp. OM2101]|uniref:hypothetical protein n=1 Tax=Bernardetia sp. OM2101 TaxID=3344876 RepID=UPI0035CF21DE